MRRNSNRTLGPQGIDQVPLNGLTEGHLVYPANLFEILLPLLSNMNQTGPLL